MAQWYDEHGVFHNTDNLEYGNQGDTRYWEGTPGAAGSVSYDRPRDDPGAQALFLVTNPAVPSITAADPDVATAGTAAAQALQRAREAANAAALAKTAEAENQAKQALQKAMDAAAQAKKAADAQAAKMSENERLQYVMEAQRLQAEAQTLSDQVKKIASGQAGAGANQSWVPVDGGRVTLNISNTPSSSPSYTGGGRSMGLGGPETSSQQSQSNAASGIGFDLMDWVKNNTMQAAIIGFLGLMFLGGGRRRW